MTETSLGNNLHETTHIYIFHDDAIASSCAVVKNLWELIEDAGLCKQHAKQHNSPLYVTESPIRTAGPISIGDGDETVILNRDTVMVVFLDHLGYATGMLCTSSGVPGAKLGATLFFHHIAMALGSIAAVKNPKRFAEFKNSAMQEQASVTQIREFLSDFTANRRKILDAFTALQVNTQEAVDRARANETLRRTGRAQHNEIQGLEIDGPTEIQ